MYEIELSRRSDKELEKIRKGDRSAWTRIIEAIQRLAADPYPPGCVKLEAHGGDYRIRIGGYRVSYHVYADELYILIIRVGTRGDFYKA